MVASLSLILWLAWSSAAYAQAGAAPSGADQAQEPDQPIAFEDQIVVSASRVEEELINAPAAVSVIPAATIQNAPSATMGDLLRAVPGLNITQVSARDVNVTTRSASSTLATSQLALVDGRSIYLDFFGMVMWDLVPTSVHDIQRIEVIRGPASAVWGANALGGVVNVITRTPREMVASGRPTTLTLSGGGFGRNVTGRDQDAGTLFTVHAAHAQTLNDRWSYRVSAGYTTQDAMPRPAGALPSGTPYPPYANSGTNQPRFNGRVDYELAGGARATFEGGMAATAGIIHTGIGPFDIDEGSRLGFLAARYERGGRRVAMFTNMLRGDANGLLAVGVNGRPIPLHFDTLTFDVEAGDIRTIGTRHALSYGGNYRHNAFDISLAPDGDDRHEGGGYVQDEIFLTDRLRIVAGGRLDKFSSIDGAVFSPRLALLVKPTPSQTLRLSFNRAFRSPSLVNNELDVTIVTPVTLPVIGPFVFPTRAAGDPDLDQETLTSYELGYSGIVAGRATVSAAVYWNETDDAIHFTPVAAYSAANPPPGWPLPPQFVPPGVLPSRYTYVNLGTVEDKGIELGIDAVATSDVTVFANYSYQWKPVVDFPPPFGIDEVNQPPRHRFNTGFSVDHRRYLGNFSVSFTDEAFWQDVLDARFAGTTDRYTLVNGSFGVKWMNDGVVTSVKVINLADREIMQHIFGDVLRRQVVSEVRVSF
jgi:iron complex outermembrane receptor protein